MMLNYQDHGHKIANLDPLGIVNFVSFTEGGEKSDIPADLDYKFHNFKESDLQKEFYINKWLGYMKLDAFINHMKKIYCGNCAIEYMHISHENERSYLRQKFENILNY